MITPVLRSSPVGLEPYGFRNRRLAGDVKQPSQGAISAATRSASTAASSCTARLRQGLVGSLASAGLCLANRQRALHRSTPHRRCRRRAQRSVLRCRGLPANSSASRVQEERCLSSLELQRKWGTDSLTPGHLQQLQRGLSVMQQERDGPAGSGFAVLEIDAPKAVVLECLEKFEDYPEMIPVVRQAEVQSRTPASGGITLARLNYKISKFWLGMSVDHVVDTRSGTVRFELDRSASKMVLEEASGFWQVEQAPGSDSGRSRVWLRVSLRASSIIPRWIIDYASRRALRRAVSWLKPYTERLWRERQLSLLWKPEWKDDEVRFEMPVPSARRLQPSTA